MANFKKVTPQFDKYMESGSIDLFPSKFTSQSGNNLG